MNDPSLGTPSRGPSTPFSIQDLESRGFVGFVALLNLDATQVPREHGVYVVVRQGAGQPEYLAESPAGKNRDHTVAIADLESGWLPHAVVLYIGKAEGESANLRTRLNQYSRSGRGLADNHRGGRRIWQLAEAPDLLVAWLETGRDAEVEELKLIREFEAVYGRVPFANRTRGTERTAGGATGDIGTAMC